jgi:hypothetical protein
VDADWERVKSAERKTLIERANKMQYMEDVGVRQLNSQALITQVLKVRDFTSSVPLISSVLRKLTKCNRAKINNDCGIGTKGPTSVQRTAKGPRNSTW